MRNKVTEASAVPPVAIRSSIRTTRSPGCDRVLADLERVGAVFEVVGVADHGAGQLADFADHGKAEAQAQRQGGGEEKAARLDRRQPVGLEGRDALGHLLDRRPPEVRVGQERRDVVEQDAGLGKIGNAPDVPVEVDHGGVSRTLRCGASPSLAARARRHNLAVIAFALGCAFMTPAAAQEGGVREPLTILTDAGPRVFEVEVADTGAAPSAPPA